MRTVQRNSAAMSVLGAVTMTLAYACGGAASPESGSAAEELRIPASKMTQAATSVSAWKVRDGAERTQVRGVDAEGRDVFVASLTFAPEEIRIAVERPASMQLVARGDEPERDASEVPGADGVEATPSNAQTSAMLTALALDTSNFELAGSGKATPNSAKSGIHPSGTQLINGTESSTLLNEESFCSWASRTAKLSATDCAAKARKDIKPGPSQKEVIRKCSLKSKEALQNFSCAKAGGSSTCPAGEGECLQIQATCTKVREPGLFMYSKDSYIPDKPDGNLLQTVATPGYAVPVRRVEKKTISGADYSRIKFTGGGRMPNNSERWVPSNCLESRKVAAVNENNTPYYKVDIAVDLYKSKKDTKPACQTKLPVGTELFKWDDGTPAWADDPLQTLSATRIYVRLITNQGTCGVKEGWVDSYSLSLAQKQDLSF